MIAVTLFLCVGGALLAQQASPTVKYDRITPKLYVIDGGCNITLFQTEKGPLIIDSGNTAPAEGVQALIRTLDQRPVVAVILTHYHDDHVGGLSILAAGAPLYAHENCFASYQKATPEAGEVLAKAARWVSYTDDTEMQFGADTVRLVHPLNAHTSGDTVVVFPEEKVIAAGDLFFNGLPPYIDVADGADTAIWADTIESFARRYSGFKVVPGHGPVSDTAGWLEFAAYLRALREGVAAAIKAGQTREQAQASVNLDRFSSMRDVGDFLTKKANIGWVYDELTKK
jgi:cyclase